MTLDLVSIDMWLASSAQARRLVAPHARTDFPAPAWDVSKRLGNVQGCILTCSITPKQTCVTKEPLAKFWPLDKPIAGTLIFSVGQGVHPFKISVRDPMHAFDSCILYDTQLALTGRRGQVFYGMNSHLPLVVPFAFFLSSSAARLPS